MISHPHLPTRWDGYREIIRHARVAICYALPCYLVSASCRKNNFSWDLFISGNHADDVCTQQESKNKHTLI